MEEVNGGCCANSVDGDRSGNDMGIDDVSVMRPKLKVNWTMNCVTILEELCQKFDIGVPRYFQSTKEGSTHRLELQLYHVLPNLTVSRFSVFGSGGTGKEAKSDAARNLMLEIKKTTREGRNLIDGVSREEFVASCEWMEKYATLNEERPKPSFKWTKGFDATLNEELPLQSEDKIAADLLDTWLSFMRPGVCPTYEVLDSPVPGRQTYRMSCKVNQHITEGIGRTEVIAKNIAARLMLNILESAEGDSHDQNAYTIYEALKMEEGNDGVNSENGDRSENDVKIDEISPPSKKSCFQILNELTHKFDIGETRYLPCDVKDSTNPLHLQLFHVSNNNITTGFSVIGSGGTRKEAKNDAARKLLLEMKKSTREGRTLISGVPKEEFVACCEWMERYATPDEELPLQPVEDRSSARLLVRWLNIRHAGVLPDYEILDTPVPGRQTFRMSCKLNQRITEGSGRSKVIAKNIAAREMLNILESAEGDNRDDNDLP